MNGEDESKQEHADYLAHLAAEAELKQHEAEPLSFTLTVNIQPFTYERIQRYVKREDTTSIDDLINSVLKDWLYMEGE